MSTSRASPPPPAPVPSPPGNAAVPAGPWLMRVGGVLLGPVPGEVLVAKLRAGEIDAATPIADEDGEDWHRLGDRPDFRIHVARAEVELRIRREQEAAEQARRRRTALRATALAVLASLLATGVGVTTWWFVTQRPLDDASEALADLGITVSPPVISLAGEGSARGEQQAWLDVDTSAPDPERTEEPRAAAPRPRPRARPSRPARRPSGAVASTQGAPEGGDQGDLGLERQYDMAHINQVVQASSRTLFPCIKAEVRRSGFKGAIPFEFVIQNDGRVGRLWIDERTLRGGAFEACFKETLAKWRFEPFEGERPTVSQSFTVGG